MEFKGTKGEWKAVGKNVKINGELMSRKTYPQGSCITTMELNLERMFSDAKLMASAPLLLKEHQTDLEFLNKWVDKFNDVFGVGSDMSQELQDMIKSKQVAIFKALS